MPRDSHSHERALPPASNEQQAEFWALKNKACAALLRGIRSGKIGQVSPEVTTALEDLASFTARHPNRSFKAFRPEDLEATVSSEDPLCLR